MGGIQEDILKIQQHHYKRIHSNLLTLECIAMLGIVSEILVQDSNVGHRVRLERRPGRT